MMWIINTYLTILWLNTQHFVFYRIHNASNIQQGLVGIIIYFVPKWIIQSYKLYWIVDNSYRRQPRFISLLSPFTWPLLLSCLLISLTLHIFFSNNHKTWIFSVLGPLIYTVLKLFNIYEILLSLVLINCVWCILIINFNRVLPRK